MRSNYVLLLGIIYLSLFYNIFLPLRYDGYLSSTIY